MGFDLPSKPEWNTRQLARPSRRRLPTRNRPASLRRKATRSPGRNGGLERIHLAFYRDNGATDNNWHFWRLEGPGFVWNYRVLPHVHTYVNVAVRA